MFCVSAQTGNYYYQDGLNKTVSKDDTHDIWYYNFIESGHEYDLEVDTNEANNNNITVFVNFRVEGDDGRLLGVIGVGLQASFIEDTIRSYEKSYGLSVYIINVGGNNHWGWIFFINVPISLIIIFFSRYMQNIQVEKKQAMDLAGALTIAAVIASLLYGLTNLDFFQLGSSLQDRKVYPFLLAFTLLMPVLVIVEKRAVDPILHIKYFKNQKMILVFIIAFITGVGMMGTVFIPQFAENVLKIKAGTGGYLITLLAVFSGVSAPLSGRLLDKKGAPLVLAVGFACILAGSLVLGYIAVSTLSFVSVMAGLALVGFGIGFTMGTPLNYLVLQSVPDHEGTTAMATMSLIRSIGTTMSPGIMIGFIAQAAQNIQPRLMGLVQQNMNATAPGGMPLNTGSQADAARVFSTLKSADVTTIVDRLKAAMQQLPDQMAPMIMQSIENIRVNIENVFQSTLNQGYTHMFVTSAIIAGVGFTLTLLLGRSIKSNQLEP